MDRPDAEFEAFLRQFRPRRPKALPTHRRTVVVLAVAAAVVVLALAIPTGFRSKGPAAHDSTVVGSGSPTPSRSRAVKELGSRPANGQVTPTSGVANRRVTVGGAVKPPIKVIDVKPVYPEDARAAGKEGNIILGIVIGQDGSVVEARVLRSIPELDQAAIDAVSQWQYEPTLLNGEPVEVEINVIVSFTL